MKSVNLAMVGSPLDRLTALASSLAKKGNESDLLLFDRKENDMLLSIVIPRLYPERLQPLLYAMHMCDAVVLAPEAVDSITGEIIVAARTYGKSGLLLAEQDTASRLLPILNSGGAKWAQLDSDDRTGIREWIAQLEFNRNLDSEFWHVDVDASFEVRGVGTVVLGLVRNGTVRVHDKCIALPSGRECSVRSIQIFDVDFKEAPAGSRVGLALKGVTVEDVPRGTAITNNMHTETAKTMMIAFRKEEYFKDSIEPGRGMGVCVGLQGRGCSVISNSERLEIETETPVVICERTAVIFSQKMQGQLRIAGHGEISKLL